MDRRPWLMIDNYDPTDKIEQRRIKFAKIWFALGVVYTDTDTVSVRLPYWHSTGTDRTQTSYFMGTTTLRDTHSNME